MTENCPSCKRPNTNLVKKIEKARVFKCPNCELVFASRDIGQDLHDKSTETKPEYFDNILETFNEQRIISKIKVAKRIEIVEEILGRKIESVLEIGCATGANAISFLEKGIKYTGIEILPEFAEFAMRNTKGKILSGDFLDQDISEKFDFIFCSQVFEHITHPNEFLDKCYHLLDNGVLHIDVPYQDSLTSKIRSKFSKNDYGFIQPYYHMLAYNKNSMKFVLNKNRFDVIFNNNLENNHPIWGQLISRQSFLNRLFYLFSRITKTGSLLVAIARPTNNQVSNSNAH